MFDFGPISPAGLAAAKRLAAAPAAFFEQAAGAVRQDYFYGWAVDQDSVIPALREAAAGTLLAADVEDVARDRRLANEFTCRISASGPTDHYEGDAPDPDDYDLGPRGLGGSDLSEALGLVCALATEHGWTARQG